MDSVSPVITLEQRTSLYNGSRMNLELRKNALLTRRPTSNALRGSAVLGQNGGCWKTLYLAIRLFNMPDNI